MRSHDFLNEDWQKVNKQDNTDGMSDKAVKAYRKENPGSKLKTAVTKKPSELKAGSKDAKRRKSFCSRMSGMKKAHASAETKRDPDSPINKALRRWNCEDVEHLEQALAEATFGTEPKRPARPGSRPARGHTESHRYSTGPVEAHGYAYNKRDQRIMFTKDFNSEQEAKEWARRNRATIIEINPKAQETNLPEISKPALGRYIKAASKDIEQRASSQSFKSGQAGDKYNKADITPQDIRREKGIDRALSKLTRETQDIDEECAGVGIVTKQNSTADVSPGTIGKNLKAFNLAQEGHDDDEYVQQLATEFIRRAKLGRRYTPAETVLGMLDRFFKKFAVNDQYFDDVYHRVVRTTDHEAGILEMETDLEEWKASRQLCRSSTPDSELGASALASCKSQGLRARDGNKSHKVGNKRITVGGHRIKGKKYGGPLPDYGTRK